MKTKVSFPSTDLSYVRWTTSAAETTGLGKSAAQPNALASVSRATILVRRRDAGNDLPMTKDRISGARGEFGGLVAGVDALVEPHP